MWFMLSIKTRKRFLDGNSKVEHIKIETRKEINYLKRMNLKDARTWLRYRRKITKRVKGDKSSAFINNMNC